MGYGVPAVQALHFAKRLRKTAVETMQTVLKDFYVDNCLKSIDTESRAVKLVRELTELTSLGGFHLTKWISNRRNVLQIIPVKDRAKGIKALDINCGTLSLKGLSE